MCALFSYYHALGVTVSLIDGLEAHGHQLCMHFELERHLVAINQAATVSLDLFTLDD